MDNLFIDTSVFISENFLEGKRIREVFRLAQEGYLQLVLPRITYNEIKDRIRKNIIDASSEYKAFREKARILRNIPSFAGRFEKIDAESNIQKLQKLFEDKMTSIGTEIIDYPTMSIEIVFEKYFNNEFPFSQGKKKNEFPDAFAISTIEKWCGDTKQKCFVISADKDIKQYENVNLIILENIGTYLDEKLRSIEKEKRQQRLDTATKLFEGKKADFEREIKSWLVEQLEDANIYTSHSHVQIHEIDILKTNIHLGDFQVVSITNSAIELNAEAEVHIEVEITTDDESTAWYDSETKIKHYQDVEIELIMKTKSILVSFEADIPITGDEHMDIRIIEINSGKDLEL